MKTKKEIAAKIKELQAERKKLPPFSMFGSNNWLDLDTKIETLQKFTGDEEWLKKKTASYDDFPEDETEEFFMLTTYDWLLGNTDML